MSVVTFLTRTKGNPDTAQKIGAQDILAYCYLAFGVLVILVPVLWTLVSSFKPEEAISTFDTRLLPYDQIQKEIDGIGPKRIYEWEREGGEPPRIISTLFCNGAGRSFSTSRCSCGTRSL